MAVEQCNRAQRIGSVRAKAATNGRQGEEATWRLFQHPELGKRTEHAVERIHVRAGLAGKISAVTWTIAKEIGEAQLASYREQLC